MMMFSFDLLLEFTLFSLPWWSINQKQVQREKSIFPLSLISNIIYHFGESAKKIVNDDQDFLTCALYADAYVVFE